MKKPLFSPTAIETFRLCERKWGFRHIDKIEAESNKYAKGGLDVHDVIEAFLTNGTPPESTGAGKIVRAGLKHLPVPGRDMLVEELWEWYPEEVEAFGFIGKCDWILLDAAPIIVGDNKSTSDFKWAKTSEGLKVDVQAVLYGYRVMRELDLGAVHLKWVYFLRNEKRPKSMAVETILTRQEAEPVFAEILVTCQSMLERYQTIKEAKELPYNVAGCDAFGGCPYREVCVISPKERMKGIMTQLSLREKMEQRAKTAQPTQAAAPVAQTAPVAQVAAPVAAKPKLVNPLKKAPINPPEAAIQPVEVATPVEVVEKPEQKVLVMKEKLQTKHVVAVSKTGPNYKAVASACEQIAVGFAAIAEHFKGL